MLEQLGHLHLFWWVGEQTHKLWLRLHGVELELRDVYPECSPLGEGPPYFRTKVRFIVTNKSKHLMIVDPAKWDARNDGVPIQPKSLRPSEPQENNPASTLQIESNVGWQADPSPAAWLGEAPRIEVPPNRTFRVWVGLKLDEPDSQRRQVEIRRRIIQRRLGNLIIPVRRSHSKHEINFKARL